MAVTAVDDLLDDDKLKSGIGTYVGSAATGAVIGAASYGANKLAEKGIEKAKSVLTQRKNGGSYSHFKDPNTVGPGKDFTAKQKAGGAAVDGFADGFMTGGIMAGASMTYGSLLKSANGVKIGTTAKSSYGRATIGYGNPSTNGNTLINISNKAGKSLFRLEADALNMVHMHYGATKAAMSIHRTGVINTIAGVISGDKSAKKNH